MTEILEYTKETDNTFRWDVMVDGAPFELYIPQWRVPDPRPSKIRVDIVQIAENQINSDHVTREDMDNHALISKGIIADVRLDEGVTPTKTIRYCPEGDNDKDWEIGKPYIPNALTYDKAERLQIRVKWL